MKVWDWHPDEERCSRGRKRMEMRDMLSEVQGTGRESKVQLYALKCFCRCKAYHDARNEDFVFRAGSGVQSRFISLARWLFSLLTTYPTSQNI